MSELGLAEFVAGLISETFEAMSASMADQLARQADLVRAAELDAETYGQLHVDADSVDQACIALFGDGQGDNPLVAGRAYVPGPPETERPAVQHRVGVVLREDVDVRKGEDGGWVFTAAGVGRVRQEIRRQLALRHQEALRLVLNKGLPRVLIDSGRILAKVTFNLTETTGAPPVAETTPAVAATGSLKAASLLDTAAFQSTLLNRLSLTRTNLLLPTTQLKVKPAADDTAQASTKSVYGEVEITFKTVS